jgi:hypothetical protein
MTAGALKLGFGALYIGDDLFDPARSPSGFSVLSIIDGQA